MARTSDEIATIVSIKNEAHAVNRAIEQIRCFMSFCLYFSLAMILTSQINLVFNSYANYILWLRFFQDVVWMLLGEIIGTPKKAVDKRLKE